MLDTLDSVDWKSLQDPDGNDASEVPAWIRSLAADDVETWAPAMEALGDFVEYRGLSEASVAAVPFLIELLQSQAVECRSQIAHLLAMLAQADVPDLLAPSGQTGASSANRIAVELRSRVLDTIRGGLDIYFDLLNDSEIRVRVMIPYLAVHLALDKGRIRDVASGPSEVEKVTLQRLTAHLNPPDEHPLMVASILLGLSRLARCGQFSNEVFKTLFEHFHISNSPTVKLAAAIAVASADPQQVIPEIIDAICYAANRPAWARNLGSKASSAEWAATRIGKIYRDFGFDPTMEPSDSDDEPIRFPWIHNAYSTCVQTLCRLPAPWSEDIVKLFERIVRNNDGEDWNFRATTEPILRAIFGWQRVPKGEKIHRLTTDTQQRILEAFVANTKMWTSDSGSQYLVLAQLGLPQTREEFRDDWKRFLAQTCRVDPPTTTIDVSSILELPITPSQHHALRPRVAIRSRHKSQ